MPAEFDIKLEDLAKIALGTPQLTNVQIAILQSLIEILLKKLNCQNETVSLNARDSKHLEEILKTAQISPMAFNDEKVEKVSEKLERVKKLEECVKKMDEKLDLHLQEVNRKSNFDETVINWETWPTQDVEHLCTTCDPENNIACTLLKNTDFIKKLLRRMAAPVIDRLFHFEEQIEELNEAFTAFIQRTEEEFLKVQLLEKCIEEIEKLRLIAEEQKTSFLYAMEEIQDILDTKLDKIHIPALKKYIRDNFKHIDEAINELKSKKTCPRAAGIIMEGVHCVSCGNTKVCSDVGVQPAAMLPGITLNPASTRKYCGDLCSSKSSKKKGAISLNMGDIVNITQPNASKYGSKKSDLPKCRKAGDDFDLLKGFDGKLYRKG